jgi:predicted CXXCH cytochrome family protein
MTCHEDNASFKGAHAQYPVAQAECKQCHDPHASTGKGLLRAVQHAPFESGNCTICHASAGSDDPFRTKLPLDELCGECHAEQVDASRDAPFKHVSAGGGRCTDCHNPHTADDSRLLKAETNALCLSCHDPAGSSSGQPGRHESHGDGLDCTTCHGAHGAERPFLLADDANELCAACHSHQHSAAHPQGEGTVDPRNGQSLGCLSCHGIHDAPHPKYMHFDSGRDLCVSCHQGKN